MGPRRVEGWLVVGCLAVSGCDVVGACEHLFHEPILRIEQVTGIGAERLASVRLGDVTIDGRPVPAARLLLGPSARVRLEGDEILCDVACGLGTDEGRYELTVRAAGYADQRISVEVRYDRFEGGCPSSNAGATRTTVSLTSAGGGA